MSGADGEPRFGERAEQLLDRAAAACEKRGSRLTAIRRAVLGLILDGDRPVGAYELLDRLRSFRAGAVPPTVYRALDFLLEQGLIHRIESLSAFVGCVHDEDDPGHSHGGIQFLICRRCRRTVELEDAAVSAVLLRTATAAGFSLGRATVEIEGLCAACAAADGEAVRAVG